MLNIRDRNFNPVHVWQADIIALCKQVRMHVSVKSRLRTAAFAICVRVSETKLEVPGVMCLLGTAGFSLCAARSLQASVTAAARDTICQWELQQKPQASYSKPLLTALDGLPGWGLD